MVYADPFHNYCVALVVPAHQALEKWAQNSGINYKDFEGLCQNDQAIKEVQQSLSKVRHNWLQFMCLNILLTVTT